VSAISPFLKGANFDPEHVRAMGHAFDEAIDERDPHTLCKLVLRMLRGIKPS